MKKKIRLVIVVLVILVAVLSFIVFLNNDEGSSKNVNTTKNEINNENLTNNINNEVSTGDREYPKFRGIVDEFNGASMIVKPIDEGDVRKLLGDKVFIDLGKDNEMLYLNGEEVVITYTGDVAESYPVQINVVEIEVEYEHITRVEDLPQEYLFEDAVKDNCVIITNMNEIYNKTELDRFVKNVEKDIPDFIRVIYYTVEGDMIITDVRFQGNNNFSVCHDSTRDKFSSVDDRTYKYYKYSDLKIEEYDGMKRYFLGGSIEGELNEFYILSFREDIKIIE